MNHSWCAILKANTIITTTIRPPSLVIKLPKELLNNPPTIIISPAKTSDNATNVARAGEKPK